MAVPSLAHPRDVARNSRNGQVGTLPQEGMLMLSVTYIYIYIVHFICNRVLTVHVLSRGRDTYGGVYCVHGGVYIVIKQSCHMYIYLGN